MAINDSLTCPHCSKKIDLSEALAHDLENAIRQKLQTEVSEQVSAQYTLENADLKNQLEEQKAKAKNAEIQELALRKLQREMEEAKKNQDSEFQNRMNEALLTKEKELSQKIESKYSLEKEDLNNQLAEEKQRFAEAQKNELELRKLQRELEAKGAQLNLEVERRIDEERLRIGVQVKKQADEELNLRLAAKDKQLSDMNKIVEDLKRKSTQTSQQLQGEVLELKIEDKLRELFPEDDIEEVKKGARGADIILTVKMPSGKVAGSVVFECKDVKEWNHQWISKLKNDLRERNNDIGVIVTTALPKDLDENMLLDGILVCTPTLLPLVASLLRDQLIKVTRTAIAAETPKDQKDLLFKYMTSNKFSQKIQGITEKIRDMQDTLESEKRSLQKNWKKREQEIETMSLYLGGFYGELEGLVGKSLPKIELLELAGPSEE